MLLSAKFKKKLVIHFETRDRQWKAQLESHTHTHTNIKANPHPEKAI